MRLLRALTTALAFVLPAPALAQSTGPANIIGKWQNVAEAENFLVLRPDSSVSAYVTTQSQASRRWRMRGDTLYLTGAPTSKRVWRQAIIKKLTGQELVLQWPTALTVYTRVGPPTPRPVADSLPLPNPPMPT